MSRPLFSMLLLGSLFVPASAWAWQWSLGASLSAGTTRSGADSGTSTAFALPSNALTYQPGFRLGYGSERRTNEVMLDGGALVIGEEGSTVSLVVGSLGYQHSFGQSPTSNPFANVCLGFLREGNALAASANTTYGAGIGWRRVLRDQRGDLRAEVRYDYLKGGGPFGRPNLTTFGLRFGFDLWL